MPRRDDLSGSTSLEWLSEFEARVTSVVPLEIVVAINRVPCDCPRPAPHMASRIHVESNPRKDMVLPVECWCGIDLATGIENILSKWVKHIVEHKGGMN